MTPSEICLLDHDKISIECEKGHNYFNNSDFVEIDKLINFLILNNYLEYLNNMYLEFPQASTVNEDLISIGFYSDRFDHHDYDCFVPGSKYKDLHRCHEISAEIPEWNLDKFQQITYFLLTLKRYYISYKNYYKFGIIGTNNVGLTEFGFTFNLKSTADEFHVLPLKERRILYPKQGIMVFAKYLQELCINITGNNIFNRFSYKF